MVSTASSLADEIAAAIIAGEIADGTRLGTKDALRRTYEVAYGTLNETLRILQERGYVTARTGPGGGLFATMPSPSARLARLLAHFPEAGSLRDCAEVRHALEEAVSVDAARSRTRTDIAALRRIVGEMAAATGDGAAYLHQNWRLHRRIAACCRNRVLANLYITLLDANEPQPGLVVPDRQRTAHATENLVAHETLVDAIASGSAERARAAVTAHEAFFAPVDDQPLGVRTSRRVRP
jgi:DNA-binding FadR family transcriptional regulator